MSNFSPKEEALINEMERILVKPVAPDKMLRPLFHYTNASGLKGIIETGNLRATHFGFLNDPQELRYGEDIVEEESKDLLGAFSEGTPRWSFFKKLLEVYPQMRLSEMINVYFGSLSEEGDLLSQWRAYGSDGLGFAIGFRTLPIPDVEISNAQAGLTLYKCEYDLSSFKKRTRTILLEMSEKFEGFLNSYSDCKETFLAICGSAVRSCLMQFAMEIPRLKYQAFAEEKEWRLVVFPGESHEEELMNFIPAANGLKPYVKVPVIGVNNRIDLDSVVIGPGRESERSLQSAKMFLKKHGYENPDLVRPSLAPYRGR